jgi:3'-phosphoadenosine 5'-phosphosulfate (PAPS) 3'-phosphatase
MNLHDILSFLKERAYDAGAIMMERIEGKYEVYVKPDRSRVTDVDLAISDLLQREVKAQWPEVQLYSEESPKPDHIDRNKPHIIADELDGTSYYIDIKKGFSHQSAFYHPEYGLCVGLVYHPDIKTMLYAIKGEGAYLEIDGQAPQAVPTPPAKPYEDLVYAHPLRYRGDKYERLYGQLGAKPGNILRTDATRTLLMAKGELDVNIFLMPRIPFWDLSGEKVIVEELGYHHGYLNRQEVEFGKAPPKPNIGYLICPLQWKEKYLTEVPRLIG